jgi:hypothetical protein
MEVKVKIRVLVELFHLQNMSTRRVFGELLNEEDLKEFEKRYKTFEDLQEAEDESIIDLIGEDQYKSIEERTNKFVEDLIIYSSYVTNADYIPMPMRVAYGRLADEAKLYFSPILEIKKKVSKLSKQELKFLEEYFGLDGKVFKDINEAEFAEKFAITGNIDDYKKEVIEHLKKN